MFLPKTKQYALRHIYSRCHSSFRLAKPVACFLFYCYLTYRDENAKFSTPSTPIHFEDQLYIFQCYRTVGDTWVHVAYRYLNIFTMKVGLVSKKNHTKEPSGYWPFGLGSDIPIVRYSPLIGAMSYLTSERKPREYPCYDYNRAN